MCFISTYFHHCIQVRDLEQMDGFGGWGFFTISRAGLTGMFSIAVTYIIILTQFKMS